MLDKIPTILVFDSGIGGISVYNEIKQKIPAANYLYLFDNEAFPYGDKQDEFLIDRVHAVISKALSLYKVDIIVIACNTASTICLPSLRSIFSIPIVGVVPAIKPAVATSKNKHIGVLATKATIQRKYMQNLIEEFAQNTKIELLGISELAIIAENKLQGIAVNREQLQHLLSSWQKLDSPLDTIVLGCTHYPFIKEDLQEIFPNVTFIDSGNAVARRVEELLIGKFKKLNTPISKNNQDIVMSTIKNEQVKKIIKILQKNNIFKYQEVKITGV